MEQASDNRIFHRLIICLIALTISSVFLLFFHIEHLSEASRKLSVSLKTKSVNGTNNYVKEETVQKIQNLDLYLHPPSQSWLQAQFKKSLTILGLIFRPPNDWRSCKNLLYTYYFPDIKTIFTGIPKTGCTNWLRGLLLAEGTIREDMPGDGNFKVHFITDRFKLESVSATSNELNRAFSFTVIRNPWTRMVSGYQNKLSKKSNNIPFRQVGMTIVKQVRGVYNETQLGGLYPTFEEFLQWLVMNNGVVDRHFTPQYNILCVPRAQYDFIVPLEYADVMTGEIAEKIGTNLTILASRDKINDPRQQKTTLMAKDWFPRVKSGILQQIYELFKADFALGSYTNFTDPDFPLPRYS